MPRKKAFRAGTVSIIGLPNAGKSTLLNALIGEKLAIVSSKPQTTRTALDGVLTLPGAQIVFVDTPGIHRSDSTYNRRMMRTVRAALEQVDVLVYVHDAHRSVGPEEEEALSLVRKTGVPTLLVVNKVDAIAEKSRLIPILEKFRALFDFAAYVPISALTGDGLELVREAILEHLPKGRPIYPEDHLTNMPSRFLAAEMIRERVLAETREEVPHAVAVLVDTWEETPKLLRIAATIYVERDGQKAILVGQGGSMIKALGTAARQSLETFFDRKVFLELFVKVHPDWRNQPEFLNELDWRRMTGDDNED